MHWRRVWILMAPTSHTSSRLLLWQKAVLISIIFHSITFTLQALLMRGVVCTHTLFLESMSCLDFLDKLIVISTEGALTLLTTYDNLVIITIPSNPSIPSVQPTKPL